MIIRRNIKYLESLCQNEHLSKLINATEGTHTDTLNMINSLVQFTTAPDFYIGLFESAVAPNYEGNTVDEIPAMLEGAKEKGFDKFLDPKSKAEKVNLFDLSKQQIKFHITSDNKPCGFFKSNDGKTEFNFFISARFNNSLRMFIYEVSKVLLPDHKLKELVDQLSAYANIKGELIKPHIRKAFIDDILYIDLGNSEMVKIDKEGYQIIENDFVPFISPSGSLPLPKPKGTNIKSINKLKDLLGLDEESWLLILSYIISALHPTGPYFVLMIEGQQGSGKSLLCDLLKQVLDPSKLLKYRPPKTLDDLMIIVSSSMIIVIDNVSYINAEMSDNLCGIATGTGVAKRQLYTDSDLVIIDVCRPIILNGIVSIATRPDLLDRSIIVNLNPMSPEKRKPERQLRHEFEEILPEVLGALYTIVSGALKHWGTIEPPKNLRMADCAEWIMAAEQAMGIEECKLINAIFEFQTENLVDRIEDNVLFTILKKICESEDWVGTVGKLYTLINNEDNRRLYSTYDLPGSPAQLSKDFTRLSPAFEKAGIQIKFLPKTKEGRNVSISYDGVDPSKSPPF